MIAALLLVACGQGSISAVEPAAQAGQAAKSTMEQAVDAIFAARDNDHSPGAVIAIVKDGRIVYSRGYGLASLELRVPNTPQTIFHVASVSKQFTAFSIQLLAHEGKLSLDDDIRKYLPELHDFGTPITINHLLHHISGLRDQWNLLNLAGWRARDIITEDDILEMTWRQKELNFKPGDEYVYCNTGFTLLAEIVHRISGMSFPAFTQERIFKPLGMAHSHFQEDYGFVVPGRAYSYGPQDGGFRYIALSYSNFGATSLFTTVEDLARWDQNFYDARVGGPSIIAAMQVQGRLNNGKQIDYASGLQISAYRGLKIVEHGGSDAGYRAELLRFPDQRFSVIILGNVADLGPATLARRVADIYLKDRFTEAAPDSGARAGGDPLAKRPDYESLTESKAEGFLGTFYSDELDVHYVFRFRAGKLVLHHPRGDVILTRTGPNTFEGEYPFNSLSFACGRAGHCNAFTIDDGRVRRLRFVRAEIKTFAPAHPKKS